MLSTPRHRDVIALACSLSLLTLSAPRAQGLELPQQAQVASYVMNVELRPHRAGQPERRHIVGTQSITWRNTASAPTDEVRMHLYLNAFRDRQSTLMRESSADFRAKWRDDEFGSVEFTEISLAGVGEPLPLTAEAVQPDDDNEADRTVVRVALPSAVAPGASIELRTRFEARLPKAYRRTGWAPGDGYFCMQWYPKLGVFEDAPDGGAPRWNCHQFHANTEFFADFARYDVTIAAPAAFEVGATGGRPVSVEERDGRRHWRFEQEGVHDFAFVADPDFVRREFTFDGVRAADDPSGVAPQVARSLGVPVSDFDLPKTEVVILLQPQHATDSQFDRHLRAVECGLEFFGLRYGPYPYGAITVVDPARDSDGTTLGGGMEYPTLITCGTQPSPHPRQPRPEGVTVHEFGHQYWYGLSANNEFEESWLDEGINTYSEGRAQWLEYAATMRPVQTEQIGALTFAATSMPTVPDAGVLGFGRVPLLESLADWGVPANVTDAMSGLGLLGTVVPESPLLELMAAQPGAVGFREASFSDRYNDRRRWLAVGTPDPLVLPGWQYFDRGSYVANSYHRPATLLRTLEALVGRERWWAFMRNFAQQSRFGHPTTADFVALLEKDCGEDAAEFFRLASEAGAVFDYGVASVFPEDGEGDTKSVVVRRYGSLTAAVRVRFVFETRGEVWRTWNPDAMQTWERYTFEDSEEGGAYGKLLEVWVDPPLDPSKHEGAFGAAGQFLIDSDLTNNAWRAEADRRPALYRTLRSLLQVQNQLTFTSIIG